MSDVSVGVVSLDLVLKDQISGMLNKYVSNIKNALNKPLQEMSDSVGKGFDKAFDSIGKTAEKMSDTVKKPMKTVEKVMNDTAESMKQGFEDSSIYAEGVLEKCFGDMAAESKKRNDAIQADLNKTTEKLSKPIPVKFTVEQLQYESYVELYAKYVEDKMKGASKIILDNYQITLDALKDKTLKFQLPDISLTKGQQLDEIDKFTKKLSDAIHNINKPLADSIKEIFGNIELPTESIERWNSELDDTRQMMSLLNARYKELQTSLSAESDETVAKNIRVQIQGVVTDLEKLESKADSLRLKVEKATKFESLKATLDSFARFEVPTDTLKRLKLQLHLVTVEYETLQKRHQELEAAIANSGSDEEIEKYIREMNRVEKKILGLDGTITKLDDKIASMPKSANPSSLKDKFKSVFSSIFDNAKSITKKAASAVKNVFGGAFNKVKSIGGKAMDHVKSKISGMKQAANGVSKPFNQLGKSLRNAAKSVFLMAGAYAVFRGLKSAISDVCNNNEEFKKSLNEVKANLQVAFTPIINAIMPAINTLMSGLAALTKGFATFVNELFGTTYKKSLEACKKVQKVGKEAKKNSQTYLAAFDEMNVAQDTAKDSDNDSGIDYDDINGDNVKLPDWAQRMKEAIKTGDWKGVGALFAEKVNAAMDAVNWNKIQAKVNGFMKSLAEGLNGFIEKLNWKKLGQSVGNGINTVFGGIYTFMKKFKWGTLGKGFADGLNSVFKTVDWGLIGATLASKWNALIDFLFNFVTTFDWTEFGLSMATAVNSWFNEIKWAELGETLSESIKGLLDTLMGFLENTDWQGIGEKIWTFIKNIDWTGIAEKLFKAIGEALGAAVALLWGFIKEVVYKIRDYFKRKMEECGGNVILGLLKGLWDGIKGIASWIKEHIFQPFIDGFKKVFGIHSPSKVMGEMGGFLIDGLLGAIKSGIELIKKVFNYMVSTIKSIIKPIADFFKNLFTGIFSSIKSIFGGIIDFIKGVFTGNWEKAWNGIKSIFKGVWDGLVAIVKTPINLIISAINFMTSKISDGLNFLIGGLNKISFDIPDWVPLIGGKKFGFDIPEIHIPQIPKLAKGGLATAPTLAVVGDNRNAKADPEVIAPLSKLEGMLGDNSKVEQLLQEIIVILKTLDLTFEGKIDERTLWKAIVKLVREDRVRTGGALF